MPKVLAVAVVLAVGCVPPAAAAAMAACPPPGRWTVPDTGAAIPAPDLIGRSAAASVVLLGEVHDQVEHHRWQAQTLAALHAHRPDMVIGVEMLPRRVQPALDRWVAGELSESAFLRAVAWDRVWGFDADLYMAIFHFARMHRVPMVALNVERGLVARVGREGWAAIPAEAREGVGDPAPPPVPYRARLAEVFAMHRSGQLPAADDDPAFRRFVEAQLVWDRAMAEGLAAAHRRTGALAVGIIGSGHLEHRWGVPHQLADLGLADAVVLLPWETGATCAPIGAGLADAVFGLAPPPADADEDEDDQNWRPRLGVAIAEAEDGVRVETVSADSVAEAAGLRAGDVILQAAGRVTARPDDLRQVIRRQAPGTWLPLSVRRGDATLDLVAKFPAL